MQFLDIDFAQNQTIRPLSTCVPCRRSKQGPKFFVRADGHAVSHAFAAIKPVRRAAEPRPFALPIPSQSTPLVPRGMKSSEQIPFLLDWPIPHSDLGIDDPSKTGAMGDPRMGDRLQTFDQRLVRTHLIVRQFALPKSST